MVHLGQLVRVKSLPTKSPYRGDAVGALYFDVLTDDAQLKALEQRLEKWSQTLERALAIKNDPLTPTLKAAGVRSEGDERTVLSRRCRSEGWTLCFLGRSMVTMRPPTRRIA